MTRAAQVQYGLVTSLIFNLTKKPKGSVIILAVFTEYTNTVASVSGFACVVVENYLISNR